MTYIPVNLHGVNCSCWQIRSFSVKQDDDCPRKAASRLAYCVTPTNQPAPAQPHPKARRIATSAALDVLKRRGSSDRMYYTLVSWPKCWLVACHRFPAAAPNCLEPKVKHGKHINVSDDETKRLHLTLAVNSGLRMPLLAPSPAGSSQRPSSGFTPIHPIC